jgi:sec-independent protein translocase protein TatC
MKRKALSDSEQVHMSLGSHLDELRRRVIFALIGVFVAMCVSLYFGRDMVSVLVEPLNKAQREAGLPPQTVVHSVTQGFAIYMKASLIAAMVLSSPWVIFQMWQFVATGLYAAERRSVYLLTPLSTAMTLLAVLFTYYLLLPICLSFFLFFSIGFGPPGGEKPSIFDSLTQASGKAAITSKGEPPPDIAANKLAAEQLEIDGRVMTLPMVADDPPEPVDGQIWLKVPEMVVKVHVYGRTKVFYSAVSSLVSPWLELGAYIEFVLMMMLGVVLGFQLPVVMLIGAISGLVEPEFLARYRRHSIFVCAALGAVLTPADPLSMVVMATPMYGLFELGLLLMRQVVKRRKAREAAEAEDGS